MAASASKGRGDSRAEQIGLHNLKPKPGSRRPRKRIGRGEGSGLGKTSGRGHKGYGSRSGAKSKAAYEGGQNPIHMRMRKLRGPRMKKSMPFENFRTRTQPVNLADLEQRFDADAEVTPETLKDKGLAKRSDPVKILARGELSKKLTVRAHAFSAAARERIEAAGGSCEVVESGSEMRSRAEQAGGDD
jgi:large subunit ribosomal protein L15